MNINLDEREWNVVLQLLSQAPWATANPLLMKMGDQLRKQQPYQPPPGADAEVYKDVGPNGPDLDRRQ
jgi:hypothetical protein